MGQSGARQTLAHHSISAQNFQDRLSFCVSAVGLVTNSASIPLVRAKGFGSLPELLEERAGERALLDVFEKEGIPLATRDAPTTPMPLLSMMRLFARSARRLGDRTLGVEIGERMTYSAYGRWTEYSSSALTLGNALHRAVTTSWATQSGSSLELAAEDTQHRVLRYVTPAMDVDKTQHSDHLLLPMVSLMRLYLGRKWQPDWIEVNYARDPDAHLVEDKLQVPMRFERPGVGVTVRAENLLREREVRPGEARRIVTLRDVKADVILMNAPEPAHAISAVIALRLLDGHSDIDGAAQLVGLSVQGLQRRLRQKGYTYRDILEEVRRARAASLLLETQLPVLEIALSLGYTDHPSFTRAFVNWMGCTPSEFRSAGSARVAYLRAVGSC
jgi:AraC-like DNA-binding protein